MFRRLAAILFALFAALAGAFAGRAVADLRRQSAAGQRLAFNAQATQLKPRDVMPGIIAALRVRDRPWSYLHIPAWLAAFVVNFAVAALSRELHPFGGIGRGEDDAWEYRPGPSTVARDPGVAHDGRDEAPIASTVVPPAGEPGSPQI